MCVPESLSVALSATATAICRSRDVVWTSDSLTIESTADKTKDRSSCNGRSESNAAYPRISFLFLTNGDRRPSSPLENGQHYTLFLFFSLSLFFFHCRNTHPSSPFVTQKTDTGRWNRISSFYFLLLARMDMIKENQSWNSCVQSESRVNLCLKLCGLFDRVWWFLFLGGVELFIGNLSGNWFDRKILGGLWIFLLKSRDASFLLFSFFPRKIV